MGSGFPTRSLSRARRNPRFKPFDVVAVQEAQKSLGALRELLVGLGRNWTVILTDPVEDDKGDDERLAFLFDRSRLAIDGLACELVVPYSWSKAKRPRHRKPRLQIDPVRRPEPAA
jgi:hypothetical protein